MGNDSAEILFQSFRQEAVVSGSGMGRDVKEFRQLKLRKPVFTCWTGAYCLCLCKPGSNVSAYTLYRMKVRGHSIFWDVEKNVPDWVKALSRSKLLPALNTHLDYMINLARGKSVTFHSLLIISLTPRLYGPHGQPCQG